MQEVRESKGCCIDSPHGVSSHSLPNLDDYLGEVDDALFVPAGESPSFARTVSGSGRLSLPAALSAQISRSPQPVPQPLRLADPLGDSQCAKLDAGEEQRHARDLARFLRQNSIPTIKTTFADRVFRNLRHLFASLQISIAVLITAEIIAKVYYAALKEATNSTVLRTLCDQILQDEVKHVEFQAEQLGKLRCYRNRFFQWITMAMQRFLYWGTCFVV